MCGNAPNNALGVSSQIGSTEATRTPNSDGVVQAKFTDLTAGSMITAVRLPVE